MRMRLPLTGTVTAVKPFVAGDIDDPLRPVDIFLGAVNWKLISIDLESEEIEIDVTPSLNTSQAKKDAAMEYARDRTLERKTKDELYQISGSKRLVNPFKQTD